ncbi:hypothetical protein SRL2020472_53160 [Mycobacterium kiyosense]|nr:hypothetical protein SRL2020472_53160 [Mycobacterium kiyosense]
MSGEDKAKNKIEDLGGRAKEAVGKVTGDRDTENEGRVDQAKSASKTPARRSRTHSRSKSRPNHRLSRASTTLSLSRAGRSVAEHISRSAQDRYTS